MMVRPHLARRVLNVMAGSLLVVLLFSAAGALMTYLSMVMLSPTSIAGYPARPDRRGDHPRPGVAAGVAADPPDQTHHRHAVLRRHRQPAPALRAAAPGDGRPGTAHSTAPLAPRPQSPGQRPAGEPDRTGHADRTGPAEPPRTGHRSSDAATPRRRRASPDERNRHPHRRPSSRRPRPSRGSNQPSPATRHGRSADRQQPNRRGSSPSLRPRTGTETRSRPSTEPTAGQPRATSTGRSGTAAAGCSPTTTASSDQQIPITGRSGPLRTSQRCSARRTRRHGPTTAAPKPAPPAGPAPSTTEEDPMNTRNAWRWPLRSRGRLIALVLAGLALALITKTILDTGASTAAPVTGSTGAPAAEASTTEECDTDRDADEGGTVRGAMGQGTRQGRLPVPGLRLHPLAPSRPGTGSKDQRLRRPSSASRSPRPSTVTGRGTCRKQTRPPPWKSPRGSSMPGTPVAPTRPGATKSAAGPTPPSPASCRAPTARRCPAAGASPSP